MLTWAEDSRPDKLTTVMTFRVESDFQVQNAQQLHLDRKIYEKLTYAHLFFNLLLYLRSNFNTRDFNSRELVQFVQLYSKRFPSFLTAFGHKIAPLFL